MNRLDYFDGRNKPPAYPTPAGRDEPVESLQESLGYMEIDTGRVRRLWGLVAYVVFFIAVATALTVLFVHFTSSWLWAALLVGFMVAYMLVMGSITARNLRQKD